MEIQKPGVTHLLGIESSISGQEMRRFSFFALRGMGWAGLWVDGWADFDFFLDFHCIAWGGILLGSLVRPFSRLTVTLT